MAILPLSGKDGFMVGRGSTGSPVNLHIYSWRFSHRQNLQTYRTSRSLGYPVGTNGIIDELLVVRGANPFATDYLDTILSSPSVEFDLGWYDFVEGDKHSTLVKGMLKELRYDFIYTKTNEPTVVWTAQFIGVATDRTIITSAIGFNGDSVFCVPEPCVYGVLRDATVLNDVRLASVAITLERQTYRTSRSNGKPVDSIGVPDIKASLVVESDFEIWLNEIVSGQPAKIYNFTYGPLAGDFVGGLFMKVASMENLHVNVQTGELVSATVNLEAAYG